MSEYRVFAGQYFPFLNWIRKFTFFSIRIFFTDTDDSQDSRGREGIIFLFHSTTSTHSRTLRHLFATLYVRWLSRIFNRNACFYQTATRWDLPPYRITIWVIDWWCNFVCLFDELILGFCYSDLTLKTGGFELASTITLVLQANWLTKCACHSRKFLYSAQLQENMDQKKLRIWLFYTQLKLRSSGQALVTPTLQILELTFWISTQVLFSSTIMKLLKRNLLLSFN